MGLFEKIFKRPAAVQGNSYWRTLDGYIPVFHSWDGRLYESELIRAAVDAKARHISKLNVTFKGDAKSAMKERLQDRPNDFQTWSQFLYRLDTVLEMQNTAFVVPGRDGYGRVMALYPVMPSMCEIVDVNGEPWVRYSFLTGQKAAVRVGDCSILTRHQYEHDLFGEDNNALNGTMQMINILQQAITESAKQSSAYRFMARSNNFMKSADLEKEQKRFSRDVLESGNGGALLFPNTWTDVKQIESRPFTVSADEQKVIRENVYSYFGVNDKILQNSAIGEDMDAFYNGAVQPFSIQFSEAVTRLLFTERERGQGNRLVTTANRLDYMTVSEKGTLLKQLGDRGGLMVDEMRELFGLAPLPDGSGQMVPIRGEYHDVVSEKELEAAEVDKVRNEDEEDEPDGTGSDDDEA